ncbi:hypothetical protein Tco_1243425 [Tanacetum coccineum]
MFQLDKFLIQEVPYHQRLPLTQKQSSKKWLNTLKNGTIEHQDSEVLKLLMDWQQYKHNSTNLEEKSKRGRMELDLEARLIGETLVLNRSLDPFLEDYIKLNDLNEPFELRRNQGDDLMPTIEEGEVIEEFRTRDDELDIGIDDYPSYCNYDKKTHIDYAHNLMFSCMIGFEFTHANFFPLLYVNVMSKKFHYSIIKDKMVYKGNNVVGALMNIPIFVGTFSMMTDFPVLESIDAYRDEGMGDVSEKDEMNGVSHAYQKLKRFYNGVLNLGPDYIRDEKTEEWLTRRHISMHEIE